MAELSPDRLICSIFESICGENRRMPTNADIPTTADETRTVVNRMESFWIENLHDAFSAQYGTHPGLTVLSKAHEDKIWGRSEFLHDLTVLERKTVKSAYQEKDLLFASRILWQVESELSGNGRDVAIDFSKLVAGSAENKLLIVRYPVKQQVDGEERVCRFVRDMAVACSGKLFLGFLPSYASSHPHLALHWTSAGCLPYKLFELSADAQFRRITEAAKHPDTSRGE